MNENGLELVGEGATTKIYRKGNTAIKLYVNARSDEADNEAVLQRFAYDAGLPVPAVYGVRHLDNNTVALDMEYIDGKTLMQPGMNNDELDSALNIMIKLQMEVQKVRAVRMPGLHDRLIWKINSVQHLDGLQKSKLLALLASLDNGACNLCHGDFHPLNILFDGTKYWIIDWVDATAGNPLADTCRTYLIFKEYISHLAEKYLRTFCTITNINQDDVLVWLPIIAAARMKENIDNKSKSRLFDIVQKWYEKETTLTK